MLQVEGVGMIPPSSFSPFWCSLLAEGPSFGRLIHVHILGGFSLSQLFCFSFCDCFSAWTEADTQTFTEKRATIHHQMTGIFTS